MSKNLKIVTYNSRYSWMGADGINDYAHRAGMIWDTLRKESPDIIAFQEVTENIRDFLSDILHEYLFLGHFRDEDYTGEGVFTAVKKSVFELLHYETFWLSPTPYKPGSRFENQSICPRACTFTKIRHKETGKIIQVYNTHLDHESNEARELGVGCIQRMMKEFYERQPSSVVFLGDLNAFPEDGVITACREGFEPKLYELTEDIPLTFHNFGKIKEGRIDYIFVSKDLKEACDSTRVWDFEHEGIYLSDHYPVCSEFKIDK